MKVEDGVQTVPAGSLPLGEGDNSQKGQGTGEQQTGQGQEKGGQGDGQDQLILGKFKSQDDLIKGYQDLEKDHGRLGTEVGSLRKQTEIQQQQQTLILNQLAQLQQSGKGQEPNTPDFDQQLAKLTADVESGDIDVASAIKLTAELTAQKAATIAQQEVAKATSQQQAKTLQDKFIEKNPDFVELQRTGQLEAIKAENPMHDDFSAFHEYKARQATADVESRIAAALEQGKQEGAKLAQGAEAAGRVLGKAGGATPRTANPSTPATEGERIAGMMGVLQGMRGGQT